VFKFIYRSFVISIEEHYQHFSRINILKMELFIM
jgi:hypothetical protein